jgi:glycosyltransferase involved in cell wall biosynthesis
LNLLMVSGDFALAAGRRGQFYALLERFARAWARVDIIVPRPPAVSVTRLFDNVHIHPGTRGKLWHWRDVLDRGRALHQDRSYALIVSHDYGWQLNGLGAWLLSRDTGTPMVSEFHDIVGYPRPTSLRAWAQGMTARLYVLLVRRHVAAFRVVNGRDLVERLSRLGAPKTKILTLYSLYIDTQVFRPRPVAKRFDVMFCGRADPNKGAPILFEAFADVVRTHPAATLLMLTAGPSEAAWRRAVDRLGLTAHVTWHSWVESADELANWYSAARMFVCTSYTEGGPRVTVEAMACGVPVISTPVGVMPEVIADRRSGLLVDWQAASVATSIRYLLDHPDAADAIGAAGRDRAAAFERSKVIDAYAAAYVALANSARLPKSA